MKDYHLWLRMEVPETDPGEENTFWTFEVFEEEVDEYKRRHFDPLFEIKFIRSSGESEKLHCFSFPKLQVTCRDSNWKTVLFAQAEIIGEFTKLLKGTSVGK